MDRKTKIFGALALGLAGLGTAGYAAITLMGQVTLQFLRPHGALGQNGYFGLFGIMLERMGLPLPGETSLK